MYSGGDQKFVWDGIVGSARDERPDPSWSSDIEFLTSQSSTNYILTDTNSEWNVGNGDFTLDMTYMPHCGAEDFNGKDGCLCPRFRTDDNAVNGTLIHKTPNGLDGIYVAIGPQTACHSGDAGYAFRFGTSATTYVELSNPYAGNYGIPMKLRFQRKGDELSIYRDGSLEARKTFPWAANVGSLLWQQSVLPYANVNEARTAWREVLWSALLQGRFPWHHVHQAATDAATT